MDINQKKIRLSYRGNKLDIVIRDEHRENGKMYYMGIDDGFVSEPVFSYQPNRGLPLKFRFETPNLEDGVSVTQHQLDQVRMTSYGAGENPDEVVQQWIIEKLKPIRKEEEFLNSLQKHIPDKLSGNENITISHSRSKKRRIVTAEYKGGNYNAKLILFSNLASTLMNEAHEFYSQV